MININSFLLKQSNQTAYEETYGNPSLNQQSFSNEDVLREEQKKNVCFVIMDEEILFSKSQLIQYSPYISQLVQDLDPTKNVRILLPKWMKKQAFIKFLKFIQSLETSQEEEQNEEKPKDNKTRFIKITPKKNDENEPQLTNNMLQISDFFQCKQAIDYCIRNLKITKDNALLNIKEALKKIQSCQKSNNSNCKECWFTLIQKSLSVAASNIQTEEDIANLKELSNKYVIKEVLERFFRQQLITGVKDQYLFENAIETYIMSKENSQQVNDPINFLNNEYLTRLTALNQKKKTYIDWNVQLKPNLLLYNSDPVKIDEQKWRFSLKIDQNQKTLLIYVQNEPEPVQVPSAKVNSIGAITAQHQKNANSYTSPIQNKQLSKNPSMISNGSQASSHQHRSSSHSIKPATGNIGQSYMYSMNRIATKQRQPNQQNPQKQKEKQLTFILNKKSTITPTNAIAAARNSHSLTNSQRHNDEVSSNGNAAESMNLSFQSSLQPSTNPLSQSNSKISQRANCVTTKDFPIFAQVEIQLSQQINDLKKTELIAFNQNPLTPQLIAKITILNGPLDFRTQFNFKIIFKLDFTLTGIMYYSTMKMRNLYQLPSIASLQLDQLKTMILSNTLEIDSEDHILHMILQWHNNTKQPITELLLLVNWSLISQEHLTYLYQNSSIIDPELLKFVKEELISRNLISNTFEAMLEEKQQEISLLKGELEKYKMGDKIAHSILESPFSYSSNTQKIRQRKRQTSNLGMTANLDSSSNQGDNPLDQSYTSNHSSFSTSQAVNKGKVKAEKEMAKSYIGFNDKNSFQMSEVDNISNSGAESKCSSPHLSLLNVNNIGPKNVNEKQRPQTSQVRKTLAINLQSLAQQADQEEVKTNTSAINSTKNLDLLINQSQKLLSQQRSFTQINQNDEKIALAAIELKQVLNGQQENEMGTTATSSKINSRATSQGMIQSNQIQAQQLTFQSKQNDTQSQSSSQSVNRNQIPIKLNIRPQPIPQQNLDKLNNSDIMIKHSFFNKLEQRTTTQKPNSQKSSSQGIPINILKNSSGLGQSQVPVINNSFLTKFRNQQSSNQQHHSVTSNQQTHQQQLQSIIGQLTSNNNQQQKRQPRFIIKKQNAQ